MNILIKRSIIAAIIVYIASFVFFGIVSLFGVNIMEEMTLGSYISMWIFNILLFFLVSKWYFKQLPPTWKRGLWLGLMILGISALLDGLFILGTLAAGESIAQFVVLYSDWKFFVTLLEVLLLCTFFGWEFDATMSKRTHELKKDA